jgi:lysophospholipase L1-like esterase
MKSSIICILFLLAITSAKSQFVYHDASQFPLLGKATQQTVMRYERLPDTLQGKIRPKVWELGKNSTGLTIRFRSNSTSIGAKWTVLYNNDASHITDVNVKGLDLYCLVEGKWRFVNIAHPKGKESESPIITHMKPEYREYMLYLPLSDCVISLEIGIDSTASISHPQIDLPRRKNPVVCYGSSIQQGISASRPGMSHTSILSRRFNREFINLGFSGNAKLDYEIAEIMAAIDSASLFILDFVPNASVTEIKEKTEHFYSIIRTKHPDTPILFVEDPIFTHTLFNQKLDAEVRNKNAAINEIFALLKQKDPNITFVSSKNMIGDDGEATVDGIHFTDLGFMRYADLLTPVIEKYLSE